MSKNDKDMNNQNNPQDTITEKNGSGINEGEEIEVEIATSKSAEPKPEPEEPPAESGIENPEKALKDKDDQYLRLAAEFDNYKKRTNREFASLIESANKELIRSLLEIVDNFKRALAESSSNADQDSLLKGMELIYVQFEKLLTDQGLEEIPAEGQPFDPELHEAVMTVETDQVPEDYVAQELQKGYMLKGKVLRHSKVSVAKPKQ